MRTRKRGEFDTCMPSGCTYKPYTHKRKDTDKEPTAILVLFYYEKLAAGGKVRKSQKSRVFETQGKGKRELKAEITEWHEKELAAITRENELASMTYHEREAENARKTDICEFIKNDIDTREQSGVIEHSTIKAYRSSLKHIKEYFEGVSVEDVTHADVEEWESSLKARGFSVSTVTKAHRLMKYALNKAVNAGYIVRNPMNGIKPPKRKFKQPSAMNEAMKNKLLGKMRERGLDSCMVSGYIALFTGMRCGEVCGLKWSDVELERDESGKACGGWITVCRSIGEKKKGGTRETRVKATKTDKWRDIPISRELASILDAWRTQKATECLAAGVSIYDTFVTGGAAGYVISERQSRLWSEFVQKKGIMCTDGTPAKMHELRHTFATLAIKHGMDIKTLSSILGHANAAMTLNIYASADPDAKRQAARIIDNMIGGNHADVIQLPKTGTDN